MAPPSWANPQQWNWLKSQLPACQEASKKSRYSTWLPEVYHAFFVEWPEERVLFPDGVPAKLNPEQTEALAEARARRQGMIRRWFNNQKNKARIARSASSLPTSLLSKSKSGRAPQAREVYCRMFYDDEKKASVQADLHAARDARGGKLSRGEVLSISRQRVDQLFEQSDASVKAAVAGQLATEKAISATPIQDLEPSRTPLEYQAAINAAPAWIEKVMAPIAELTGWSFTVMGAGPSPEEGGEIGSFAVHFGTNPSGHTFGQATSDFREKFIRPLVYFAKGVHSQEERLARSLNATPPPASVA